MSEIELTANDLIGIGKKILILLNPQTWKGTEYRKAINEFVSLTDKCGFRGAHEAGLQLKDTVFYVNSDTDDILPNSQLPLSFNAHTLNRLLKEAGIRKKVRIADTPPPNDLVNLAARIGRALKPHQEALRNDTALCLSMQISRPAIVMAWALGFDLVRSWVFDNTPRLDAFNKQLASSRQRGEPNVVNDFEDFFQIGEYRFLSICRDSQELVLQGFTDNQLRDLQGLLDHRNDFAHANYNHASVTEATAYVERLIRILTGPPFDK